MSKGQNAYLASQIRESIIKSVGRRPKTEKKILFGECLEVFNLTDAEKKDRSSDGKLTLSKSIIGSAIAEMLREGAIELVDDYYYKFPDDVSESDLITEERIENFIIELMADNVRLTKKQLFDLCEKEFDTDGNGAEHEVIHRRGGNVIARMVKSGVLIKEAGGKYGAARMSKFPNTDLGKCLEEAAEGGDVKKCFIAALNLKGGEFFESFSVNLVKRILEKTATVVKSEVVGGANDNGIDGIIECYDNFGFKDKILIQARTRGKGTITLKELREFYGALTAEKGTRGIFVSTASFHKEAAAFANRISNLVYLGGDKLFALASELNFGLVTSNNKVKIDNEFFLESGI